jgi:thermitase
MNIRTLLIFLIILIFPFSEGLPVEVSIRGNRLSVNAENEPLRDILQALAEQGVTVHADPEINPDVTFSFSNREMGQGLNTLLRNLNYILIWKPIETPAGQYVILEEVRLFFPGKKELVKTLQPGKRQLVKNPNDGSVFVKNEILLRLSRKIDLNNFENFLFENGLAVSDYNITARILKIIMPEKSDYFAILELINRYPGIEKAEANYAYPVNHPFFVPGLSTKTSYPEAKGLSKNSAPIAVIDSGLSQEYLSAPYVYRSFNSINPDAPLSDSLGHGTQMAMIAGGAVKPLGTGDESDTLNPVIAIKGFDEEGYISNFDLMNGIEFALNNGARVMSLSWGSETKSEFLDQTFDYAASKGLIIVAAAGNEPTGNIMYPAAYDSVIGVGALDPEGKKWDKSNYGDFVTIYAPGFASFPVGYKGEPGAYAGTSISTAFLANQIAGYLSKNPDATIKEILTALTDKAENEK